jgi:hypothetical protein
LLCKHQVIGSIPIGSTNPQFWRRISPADSHQNQDGQRCTAAPQGAALPRLTAQRAHTLANIQLMKKRVPMLASIGNSAGLAR